MTKHPDSFRWAPWHYFGGGIIFGEDKLPVAYLAGRMNDGNADVSGNVMAAAPDLYQALTVLLECNPDFGRERFAAALDVARTALAKARGEHD